MDEGDTLAVVLRIITRSSLSLALLGCGAGPIPAGDGTDSGMSSDTGSSTMDSVGDGDGDGDGDGNGNGDGDGDGDGDAGDGDGDGDGDEPPECQPPQPVTASFTVSPATALTATCVVMEEIHDNDLYHLELDCDDTPVAINVESTILAQPYAEPMTIVELDYRTDPDAPNDHWLAIHPANSDLLILGGVQASRLDPPGTTLAAFFRNPGLSVLPEQTCASLTDSCGGYLRLALAVAIDPFGVTGDPAFDHGSWFADFLAFGFAIEVETATRRVPPHECDGAPDEWFALVAVGFPSD